MLSYAMTQRVREIGLKTALGARAANVAGDVVVEGMLPVCAGILVGALAASALFTLADSLLFEVATTDATAFVGAIGVLLTVAGVACGVPARRAARIDPAAALRE